MIHLVVGGSLSGKTTFVRKRFIERMGPLEEQRIMRVPVSVASEYGKACVVGHYSKPTRTCGVDQMGRDTKLIHERLRGFLDHYWLEYQDIVMEGNAIADEDFFKSISGFPIKLYLILPKPEEIGRRAMALKINYGRSIIALSYRRAYKVWNAWKGVFNHELIDQQEPDVDGLLSQL